MKPSKMLIWLALIVAVLTLIISSAGIFWQNTAEAVDFVTVHGEKVYLYGRGLYALDPAFKVPVLRGTDAIMLLIGIPILIFAITWYRRGSIRGALFLTGVLACFFYNAFSITFGVAYNALYLVYVVCFSASLYALVLAVSSIDTEKLGNCIEKTFPHRGIAIFLILAGLSPLVWLIDIVNSMLNSGVPPLIGSYTTDVTTALDVGVITPACMFAAIMLLKRKPLAYVLSPMLLILLTLIGLIVIGQSLMQFFEGVRLSAFEILAFALPFILLSFVSGWLVSLILRNVNEPLSG